MRVEFHPPDDPERVVAEVVWDGSRAVVRTPDEDRRAAVEWFFRPTPVVLEDPALRPRGSRGETVLQPGSLEWFRAAALTRGAEAGLVARIVPEVAGPGGWDPAAAYRTFRQSVDLLLGRSGREGWANAEQPGDRPSPAREASLGRPPAAAPEARN
jgi:hypothetical protein